MLSVSILVFISISGNFIVSQELNDSSNINNSTNLTNTTQNLSVAINSTINSSIYNQATWGILVIDQETGKVVYEKNSQKMFVPGSTTKLFITAAALSTYGPDYKFETPVYYTGDIDSSGVLKGNLTLVASGDLTMGGRNTPDGKLAFTNLDHNDANAVEGANITSQDPLAGLNELARQVKSSGINKIEGEVIIDDRLFETTAAPTGDYVISPIMINDNLIDLQITPGKVGENATIVWRPQTSLYKVVSRVETVSSGEVNINVNFDGKNTIIVSGQIPANSTTLLRTYAVQDPASFARSLFIEALKRQGVEVTASANAPNPQELLSNNTTYDEEKRVALLTSLPFSENIKVILKTSHNIQADTLVSLLAAKNGKKTFAEGMLLEGSFLSNVGIDPDNIALNDGRGGSSSDRISPQDAVTLLQYVSTQNYSQAYFDALPIMGYDGTLAGKVSNNSSIYGKVNAKTGTTLEENGLTGQGILLGEGMAGYMTTASGKKLIFAIYINNMPANSVEDSFKVQNDIIKVCKIIYDNY